jgi:hypothetical protein
MRAKSINEDQNFERGTDPKKSMGIGKSRSIDMKKGVDALTHFMYYADGRFIGRVWEGWMVNHLEEKLKAHIRDGYMDPNALMKFIRDLDKGNQDKLYDYIIENHSDQW